MSNIQFNNKLTDEIKVSAAAIEQFITLTEQEEDIVGVRVYVSGGGCDGMKYGMTLVEQPHQYDCVLEADGMKIYVDAVTLGFFDGVEIDYVTQGVNQNFIFRNAFASTGGSGTCGTCGAVGGGCGG